MSESSIQFHDPPVCFLPNIMFFLLRFLSEITLKISDIDTSRRSFLFWTVFKFHGLLISHMTLSIHSRYVKNCMGILKEITLTLHVNFAKMNIHTTLILSNCEHERSLHLLVSSSISFFKVLKRFIYTKSVTCMPGVAPEYFVLLLFYII